MTLGESIKKARKEKGLTQKRLAQLTGNATGTIQQYELGKRQPRLEQLEKIAEILEVDSRALLDTGELWWQQKGKLVDVTEQDLMVSLDSLVPDSAIALSSAIRSAIENISRIGTDAEQQENIARLANIITHYGYMVLSSHGVIRSSEKNPDDYLYFMHHYNSMAVSLHQGKEKLIESRISELEDSGELQKLIYGNRSAKKLK